MGGRIGVYLSLWHSSAQVTSAVTLIAHLTLGIRSLQTISERLRRGKVSCIDALRHGAELAKARNPLPVPSIKESSHTEPVPPFL